MALSLARSPKARTFSAFKSAASVPGPLCRRQSEAGASPHAAPGKRRPKLAGLLGQVEAGGATHHESSLEPHLYFLPLVSEIRQRDPACQDR